MFCRCCTLSFGIVNQSISLFYALTKFQRNLEFDWSPFSRKTGFQLYLFEVTDIKTWANMGLNFAEKLKGAMALETYRLKGWRRK